ESRGADATELGGEGHPGRWAGCGHRGDDSAHRLFHIRGALALGGEKRRKAGGKIVGVTVEMDRHRYGFLLPCLYRRTGKGIANGTAICHWLIRNGLVANWSADIEFQLNMALSVVAIGRSTRLHKAEPAGRCPRGIPTGKFYLIYLACLSTFAGAVCVGEPGRGCGGEVARSGA